MLTWKTVGVLAALFAGIGYSIDKFMVRRHRRKVHDKVLGWWCALDEASVPDLPKLMASQTLAAVKRVFGDRWLSWRSVIITVCVSFFLTASAFELGAWIDEEPSFFSEIVSGAFEGVFLGILGLAVIFTPNLFFDVLTAVITIRILHVISSSGTFKSLFAILLDLTCAIIFAAGCFHGIGVAFAVLSGFDVYSFSEINAELLNALRTVFFNEPAITGDAYTTVLYCSTTLIPTALYLALLFLMIMAKPLLYGLKISGVYFLERSAEDTKTTIFTLTGAFFSIIALLAKSIHYMFFD